MRPSIIALILLLGIYSSANASMSYTLQIDSTHSSIQYSENSATEYEISGQFNLISSDNGFIWSRDNLRLINISTSTDQLPNVTFSFPYFCANLSGNTVYGSRNDCEWIDRSGSCVSSGRFDNFSGTFNGTTLTLSGIDYLSMHSTPFYSYQITAQVLPSPVPLPPALLLFAPGLAVVGFMRRRIAA